MAHFGSYNWNYKDRVCEKHLLPCIPCPACLQDAKNDPEMYLELSYWERSSFADEMDIPLGFNPDIHAIH